MNVSDRLIIFKMYFLFLLAFKYIRTYQRRTPYILLPSFGFDINGTYNLSFYEQNIDLLLYIFDNSKCYNTINRNYNHLDECKGLVLNETIDKDNKLSIDGVASSKMTIYPIIVPIDREYWFQVTVEGNYQNPNSYLDTRWWLSKKSGTIMTGFFLIFAVTWLVNWVMNFKQIIQIHILLTSFFTWTILTLSMRVLEITYLDKYPTSHGTTEIRILLMSIALSHLFFFLILAFRGWCIVSDVIDRRRFWYDLLSSCFASLCIVLSLEVHDDRYESYIFFLTLIGLFSYVYFIAIAAHNTNQLLIASMLMTSTAGIENEFTPTHNKEKMFKQFENLVLIDIILVLLYVAFCGFWQEDYWITELIGEIILLCVLIGFAFLFRLRKNNANDSYMHIHDDDDDDVRADEVPLVDFGSRPDPSGFPTQPLIEDTPNVLLSSPDGTTTVTAKFTSVQDDI